MAKRIKESNFPCDLRTCFATAFKNCRRKNSIPLKKIAGDLGLSIATVNAWELGERFPTGRHIELLAGYTGMSPCQLFCNAAVDCQSSDCPFVARN